MSVDAIIPTIGKGDWQRTVESLFDHVDNIIVIESGQDVYADEDRCFRDAHLFKRKELLSFGDACRFGVEHSHAKRILFINDDAFAYFGAIDLMLRSAAPVAGACLVYANGAIQHGGGSFLPNGLPYHLHRGMPADFDPARQTYGCPWVTFAAAIVDRHLWNVIGGFSRSYKNGYEDVDFCLRAKEIGAHIEYVGEALFQHNESITINHLGLDQEANWRTFQKEWVATGRLWNVVKEALW